MSKPTRFGAQSTSLDQQPVAGTISRKWQRVYEVLRDLEWHCRVCSYDPDLKAQIAGSGGIKGLKSRGYVVDSSTQHCPTCNRRTYGDRLTGEEQQVTRAASIPTSLARRILKHYGNLDVIEQRKRSDHELVIDHRFPMLRWNGVEPPHDREMAEDEIEKRFQLLKKDPMGNHNLLKSRACEACLQTGQRGTPFGIEHFYAGTDIWPDEVPQKGAYAEHGCVGCGWYDFDAWRRSLNSVLDQARTAGITPVDLLIREVSGVYGATESEVRSLYPMRSRPRRV